MFLMKKLIRLHWLHERMESFDSIEAYAYGKSKELVSEKEEVQCNNIIKQ